MVWYGMVSRLTEDPSRKREEGGMAGKSLRLLFLFLFLLLPVPELHKTISKVLVQAYKAFHEVSAQRTLRLLVNL